MLANVWKRKAAPAERSPRARFSLVTSLRGPGGPASILLHELSSSGFCAETLVRFTRGTPVRLNLPGLGEIEATILRARGGMIGGTFAAPIDVSRCIAAANWIDAA